METLKTIRQYIQEYQQTSCRNLSTEIMDICFPDYQDDWLLPDTAFKIDAIANMQKRIDRDLFQNRECNPDEFVQPEHLKQTAETVIQHMTNIWTCMNRGKYGYNNWQEYLTCLQHNLPHVYNEIVEIVMKYATKYIELMQKTGHL